MSCAIKKDHYKKHDHPLRVKNQSGQPYAAPESKINAWFPRLIPREFPLQVNHKVLKDDLRWEDTF
ncbi:Uncharacterised protein [Chlamydia abortus]|nr:Uncharacterised protein [Chlamydia abortus]